MAISSAVSRLNWPPMPVYRPSVFEWATANGKTRVVAQGGDGGTTDIGFGCLSGMFERNDDVLYLCYDNEAYMNTGVQRSSLTPIGAHTTNSPAGTASYGEKKPKKNLSRNFSAFTQGWI